MDPEVVDNLKQKCYGKIVLLTPYLNSKEIKTADLLWISENQMYFIQDRLKIFEFKRFEFDFWGGQFNPIWGKNSIFDKFRALFWNIIGSTLPPKMKVHFYKTNVDQTAPKF